MPAQGASGIGAWKGIIEVSLYLLISILAVDLCEHLCELRYNFLDFTHFR